MSTNSLKSDFSRMAGVRISQSDNNRAFVHLHKNPFALVCPVWNHLTCHCIVVDTEIKYYLPNICEELEYYNNAEVGAFYLGA